MKEFCIMDRVKVLRAVDENESIVGKEATILAIESGCVEVGEEDLDAEFTDLAALRFEEPIEEGHDLEGRCREGYGWYVPLDERFLKVVERKGKPIA